VLTVFPIPGFKIGEVHPDNVEKERAGAMNMMKPSSGVFSIAIAGMMVVASMIFG
jgi:hypothetical protein